MEPVKSLLIKAMVLCYGLSIKVESHYESFHEEFDGASPEYFRYVSGGNQADFTHTYGVDSKTEPGTSVLSFKIGPSDPPGAGRGPEIISKEFTHYGTYSTRIKVPDVRSDQPNVGAVVGYFTYHMDDSLGLSEIDFELAYC